VVVGLAWSGEADESPHRSTALNHDALARPDEAVGREDEFVVLGSGFVAQFELGSREPAQIGPRHRNTAQLRGRPTKRPVQLHHDLLRHVGVCYVLRGGRVFFSLSEPSTAFPEIRSCSLRFSVVAAARSTPRICGPSATRPIRGVANFVLDPPAFVFPRRIYLVALRERR